MEPSDVEKLRAIVCETLAVAPDRLTLEVRFVDLGADSLDIVELAMRVEDAFGVTIPEQEHARFVTLGDAIEYLDRARRSS